MAKKPVKRNKVNKQEEKPKLRKYEEFLSDRLIEYTQKAVNNELNEDSIARLMKAFRIYVEQTVRRIAYRQKWSWIPPVFKVRDTKKVPKK